MVTRSEIKRHACEHVKQHYWLLVILCAVSVVLGTEFSSIISDAQSWYDRLTGQTTILDLDGFRDNEYASSTIGRIISGPAETVGPVPNMDVREVHTETGHGSDILNGDMFARQKGVLAAFMNNRDSGRFYTTLSSAFLSLIHSESFSTRVMIISCMLFYALIRIFIRDFYQVILRRAFLETRTYRSLPLSHLLHFNLVHRWTRASLSLLLASVCKALWSLTIIGGFIKHYAYYLVPYILAENPDLYPREAILLSSRMMDGHKWECFKMELSFLGWQILGYLTFGLTQILWSIPYRVAFFTEYYTKLREDARIKGIEGISRLNDDCLFTPAEESDLQTVYADIIRHLDIIDEDIVIQTPVKRFFARCFGIWMDTLDEKTVYTHQAGLRHQTRIGLMELRGEAYPERLNVLWSQKATEITGKVNYLAPCTIWTLIIVFFAFCILGWLWEVSLHLLTHGEFVNRGALHGPWLPIYGSGVVLIAVLLYRFRNTFILEALTIILLCGFVEYMTSYVMELMYGMRWWDYTGYFLNLNGRICGEGLAVFALGGMIAIYCLLPLIDALVSRIRPRILISGCILLMLCFTADVIYSHYVPNAGAGITDDPVIETKISQAVEVPSQTGRQ